MSSLMIAHSAAEGPLRWGPWQIWRKLTRRILEPSGAGVLEM